MQSFIIICPTNNIAHVRTSVHTMQRRYPETPLLCVLPEGTIGEPFHKLCRTISGGNTLTSLMNAGIQASTTDWNFIYQAGLPMRKGIVEKYLYFRKSDKDILYAVYDRKHSFEEASINGLFLHKRAFQDMGTFAEQEENLELVKLFWATAALEKGYRFKALVGVRLV